MATFAPTNFPSDVGDKPHQEPPPQHLQHGPFAHQLNPPTAQYTSNPPQISRRASRDLRPQHSNGAMAGANGHGPMAVPGGRINGQEHRANLREMGFAGPRSPPNNKSTSRQYETVLASANKGRYLTRALQVLPTRRMSGWEGVSVLAFR
jgi:hypothetical protein